MGEKQRRHSQVKAPPHQHSFQPLGQPFAKKTLGDQGMDRDKLWIVVYCPQCAETRELICQDHTPDSGATGRS